MVWISLVIAESPSELRLQLGRRDHASSREQGTWEVDVLAPSGGYLAPLDAAAVPRAVKIEVTARQLECLAWVAQGKSASEIGIILGISGRTVEKHIAKICGVFGVVRRIQAVDCARRLGLIS